MTESLRNKLRPVQRRQFLQTIALWAVRGLLCGAVLAMACGVARLWLGWSLGGWAAAALGGSPLLAGLAALAWQLPRPNWSAAAQAIDSYHRLKDRTASALDLARRQVRAEQQPFAELQLADALEHLDRIEPQAIAPYRAPRLLPSALLAAAVAIVLSVIPVKPSEATAGPIAPDEQIVAEADVISENLKELAEELKQDQDPQLDQLVKELQQKAEELKEPGVDVKEALAKISEMQAALVAAQNQAGLEQVDQQLQEIGEALASAKALQAAGQALAEGKYDKALKDLAELEDPQFDRQEARTTTEKLKKAAKKSDDGQEGALSQAAQKIADAIEESDCEACKAGLKKLGECVSGQCRKKKISDMLKAQLAGLGECKGNCQKNSLATGKQKKKSNSPSSKWGMGESGNIDGDPTELGTAANREQLQGLAGDGESETETSSSPEGRQTAQRSYKEVYQKYRKMSDAVLDNEQIPLGHRQTIRHYFESIRPQQGDAPAAVAE